MTNILTQIGDEIVAEAKVIVADFEGVIKNTATAVVVAATQTSFGGTILNLVSAASSKTATGAEKAASVIGDLISLGEQFLAGGGWAGLFASVEHFLAAAVQLVFNNFAADLAKVKSGV